VVVARENEEVVVVQVVARENEEKENMTKGQRNGTPIAVLLRRKNPRKRSPR